MGLVVVRGNGLTDPYDSRRELLDRDRTRVLAQREPIAGSLQELARGGSVNLFGLPDVGLRAATVFTDSLQSGNLSRWSKHLL